MISYDPYAYRFPSRRRDLYAANAMVASSHPLATAAGIKILEKGGNAIDACVAVAIALPVVEPAATTFGSDNFAIIWSGGKLHGMSSSGSICAPGIIPAESPPAAGTARRSRAASRGGSAL